MVARSSFRSVESRVVRASVVRASVELLIAVALIGRVSVKSETGDQGNGRPGSGGHT
jgi:hypothetical protein